MVSQKKLELAMRQGEQRACAVANFGPTVAYSCSMSNVEKFEAGKSVAEDGNIQQMVAEGLFKWEDLLVANSQR
eukprot:COSAG01_NODE_51636_length_353_cov_0.803150_1_plen_73_part_01